MAQSEVRMGIIGTGGFANQAHMPGEAQMLKIPVPARFRARDC